MRPFLAVLVAAAVLAGCLSSPKDDRPAADVPQRATVPATGLDTSLLSQDEHAALGFDHAYVTVRDGVKLHVEVWLPDDTQGPWPTILEASPYNGQDPCTALPTSGPGSAREGDPVGCVPGLAARYVPKGYAVVYEDVRGTAESEGCMDMMGAKEQADQYDVVEWIAAQPWSDGNVGMQGVSYVGTTPHEALIMDPPHLKAVATVAGVTNQWRNMYQNGVPYQGRFYPLTYEATDGAAPPVNVMEGPSWALNAANGACDQEQMAEHVRPGVYEKGVYDAYWAERNFTVHAKDVRVPILNSQGFADRAVNPMEEVYWFNDIPAPKKQFLHQAGHQYVARGDYFDTELAWFDHYLKGIDNGVDRMPIVEVLTNTGKIRIDDEWPPTDAVPLRLNLTATSLSPDTAPAGTQDYLAPLALNAVGTGVGASLLPTAMAGLPTSLTWTSAELGDDLYVSGNPVMHLQAASDQVNTYFLFDLLDVDADGNEQFVSEGWFNAHLREGFDHSAPLTPGTTYPFTFRFEPFDHVFEAGHAIRLRVNGIDPSVLPFDTPVATNTVHEGPDGSWLELPTLADPVLFDVPEAAKP